MKLSDFKTIARTDKFVEYPRPTSSTGHGYVDLFYEEIMASIRDSATAMLEIGTDNGDSHLLWHCYMPAHVRIYGVDTRNPPYPNFANLLLYSYTDAYNNAFVEHLKGVESGGFDLIIDDGSHWPQHQLFVINNYNVLLKPGGVMVIEDIFESPTPNVIQTLTAAAAKWGRVKFYDSMSRVSYDPEGVIKAAVITKFGDENEERQLDLFEDK